MLKARVAFILVVAAIASVMLAAALPDAILAGDAEAYRDHMAKLFSGRLPYFEFNFEHLPGAIIPMAAAWLLGGSDGLPAFAFALAGVSTLVIVATGLLLVDLEPSLDTGLTMRWVVAMVPLLPFLLFRNDSLSVLLVVASFWFAIRSGDRGGGTVVAWIGVATKIWPGAWTVVDWWRRRRLRALVTFLLTAAALFTLRTESILAIQRPIGVHTETLAGSLVGLFRFFGGVPLQLHQTSSLYIDVPWWAHAFNLLPAVVLALAALTILRRTFSWSDAWLLFGTMTGSLMLASPLFSTQYMAWITPFASGRRRHWALLVFANIVSLVVIVTWTEGLAGVGWWFAVVLARNLLFVFLLASMVFHLITPQGQVDGHHNPLMPTVGPA